MAVAASRLAPPRRVFHAPPGPFVLVTAEVAEGKPILADRSLVPLFVPPLRRLFARRELLVPVFSFLPERLVLVAERTAPDADLAAAMAEFLVESGRWMRARNLAAGWEPEIEMRAIALGDVQSEVRRVLELSRTRNLIGDPYLYPYTGSVGRPVWERLGDARPERATGFHA